MLWSVAVAADLVVDPMGAYPTIVEAVDAAQPGDRIVLPAGVLQEPVVISERPDLVISGAGSGPNGTVLQGNTGAAVWVIRNDSSVVLEHLSFDGRNTRRGLHILERASVQMADVVFRNGDRGAGNGGALLVNRKGMVHITGGRFADNVARLGGAVYCSDADRCSFEDVVFVNNAALVNGGAVLATSDTPLVLRRASACFNTVGANGGAVFVAATEEAEITNSLFEENVALAGGGIHVSDATVVIRNNTFVENLAIKADNGTGAAIRLRPNTKAEVLNNLIMGHLSQFSSTGAFDYLDAQEEVTGGYNLYFSNLPEDAYPAVLPNAVQEDPRLPEIRDCQAPLPPLDSPAIDAGAPDVKDPDGSDADIGATGGPDAVRDRDGDGFADDEDCDDLMAAIHPAAPEICNDIDDDCDGLVDDEDPSAEVVCDPMDAGEVPGNPVVPPTVEGAFRGAGGCSSAGADGPWWGASLLRRR